MTQPLFGWPGPQPKGKRGKKPKKGERHPSLKEVLKSPFTEWHRSTIRWYGGTHKAIDIVTGTSLWYTPGFDPLPIRWVLVRDPMGKFKPTAFFCTELSVAPRFILAWFIMRWSLEVTFQESRSHLGLETQRQWSDLAILRTTPALLGIFSLITLIALHLSAQQPIPTRSAAWYVKPEPTFSDIIAFVRFYLWTHIKFTHSSAQITYDLIPGSILSGLIDSICFST